MVSEDPWGFGELLRRYRLEAGLTQEELADRAGLSARAVSDLERHIHRTPYPHTVRRLTQALGVTDDAWLAFRNARAQSGQTRASEPHSARLHAADAWSRVRTNLPAELTSFIGREQELRQLLDLAPATRLLTLVGPGGVGKSRLGRRLAAEMLNSFQDGVCLVELGALTDPSHISQAVGVALGVRDQPGTPLLHTLVSVLRRRHMLLVLDDCEHLSEASADLTAGLLRGCPRLHILATSRVVLNVAGEVTWHVPALSVPDHTTSLSLTRSDAVRLFVERARAVRPDFSLTDDTAASVGEVCVRLDGLPLSLELAAAWMRTLSIRQLASRLNDRFTVLVGGASNVPSRQRTLRATLDWSHALLDDVEQRLFDRVAVFVGGATLDAIEAVCGNDDIDSAQVLGTLRRLVEASLVFCVPGPFGEPRYAMLDLIRVYARERLANRPEASELEARHAAYYVALLERPDHNMWEFRPGEALVRVEAELGNLRAAALWALNLPALNVGFRLLWNLVVWVDRRGHPHELLQWGEQFLALDNQTRSRRTLDRAQGLVATAYAAVFAGQFQQAQSLAVAAEADYRALAQTPGPRSTEALTGAAFALFVQAYVPWFSGQPGLVEPILQEAISLGRSSGATRIVSWASLALGVVLATAPGRFAEGMALLEEWLPGTRQGGDLHCLPRACLSLGAMLCHQGDIDRAASLCREALALSLDAADDTALQLSLDGLARVASREGRHERAARLLGAADARYEAMGVNWPRNPYAPAPGHLDFVANVRERLGVERFARLSDEARGWSIPQAIAYALKTEVDETPPRRSCGPVPA